MKILSIEKTKVVLGLEWSPLTSDNLRSEAAALSKSRKKPLGVVYENRHSGSAQIGLAPNQKASGAISGGALFASLIWNGLIVQSTGNDNVWVCLVQNGDVIVGYDFVSKREEARRVLSSLVGVDDFADDPLEGMALIADSENITFLGEIVVDTPREATLKDLVKEDERIFPKNFLKLRIKPVKSNSLALIAGAVAVVGVLGFYYTAQQEPSEDQSVDMSGLASLQEPKKETPKKKSGLSRQEKIANLIEAARDEEAKWIRDQFSHSEVSHAVDQAIDIIDFSNLVQSGWRMSTVEIASNRVNQTLLSKWDQLFGTQVDFERAFPKNGEVTLSGDRGVVRRDLSESEIKNVPPMEFINRVKEGAYSKAQIMTSMDRLPVDWELVQSEVSGRPETIDGMMELDRERADVRQLNQKWYQIRVTGNSIRTLSNAADILGQSGNVVAKTIIIDVNNGVSWEIRGRLYEF